MTSQNNTTFKNASGLDFRVWISWNNNGVPSVDWDYDATNISGYKIANEGILELPQETTIELKTRAEKSKIEAFDVIPNSSLGHLVTEGVVRKLTSTGLFNSSQDLPVKVRCKNGKISTKFSLLRPIKQEEFYDLVASDVDYNDKMLKFYRWTRLVPLGRGVWPDFFREKNSGHLIVSIEFSEAIGQFIGSQSAFIEPDKFQC